MAKVCCLYASVRVAAKHALFVNVPADEEQEAVRYTRQVCVRERVIVGGVQALGEGYMRVTSGAICGTTMWLS